MISCPPRTRQTAASSSNTRALVLGREEAGGPWRTGRPHSKGGHGPGYTQSRLLASRDHLVRLDILGFVGLQPLHCAGGPSPGPRAWAPPPGWGQPYSCLPAPCPNPVDAGDRANVTWSLHQSIGVSASASVLSNEYSGLISFSIDWLDLLAVQGTLKSLLYSFLPCARNSSG